MAGDRLELCPCAPQPVHATGLLHVGSNRWVWFCMWVWFMVVVLLDDRPGSRCLLGESITYERRRSDVCCFVHPGYNRLISRSVCTCTQEDFEWYGSLLHPPMVPHQLPAPNGTTSTPCPLTPLHPPVVPHQLPAPSLRCTLQWYHINSLPPHPHT